MEHAQEKNIFCDLKDESVSKQECRRCPEYTREDIFGVFDRCRIKWERTENALKTYRKRKKREVKE